MRRLIKPDLHQLAVAYLLFMVLSILQFLCLPTVEDATIGSRVLEVNYSCGYASKVMLFGLSFMWQKGLLFTIIMNIAIALVSSFLIFTAVDKRKK